MSSYSLLHKKGGHPVLARVIYPAAKLPKSIARDAPVWMDVHGLSEIVRVAADDIFGAYTGYLTFVLHHLSLVTLPMHKGAPLAIPVTRTDQGSCGGNSHGGGNSIDDSGNNSNGFPLLIFSHGLFGGREMYTSLCQDLASWGFIVLVIQHQDGSSPVVVRPDGTRIPYKPLNLVLDEYGEVAYVHARRDQTDFRVAELAEVVTYAPRLCEGLGIDLPASSGAIDASRIVLGGHSFGGATVLTYAARHPSLLRACLVFDPAIDWMPADARDGLMPAYHHGESPNTETEDPGQEGGIVEGLGDVPTLFLYSDSWRKAGVGKPLTIRQNVLGRQYGIGSAFAFVDGTSHQSPADNMVLLPHWLYHQLGVCSDIPPHESMQQIAMAFSQYALTACGSSGSNGFSVAAHSILNHETPHLSEVVPPTARGR